MLGTLKSLDVWLMCMWYIIFKTKLDSHSVVCVLLGVSEESKACRLYNPIDRKIIISQDVVFDEDECWNWEDDFTNSIQS